LAASEIGCDKGSAVVNHESRNTQYEDIAIIGMACMFPGAPNLAAFWQNIVSKVDAITDPPPEAWDSDIFYDPSSDENDRVYCKKGGYLGPLAYFNPLEHGIMPRAAEGGEPDQWLALQVARDALADAGYPDGPKERHRTAVILGKGTYINRGNLTMVQHSLMVDQTLQVLKTLHPELTEEELQLIRRDLKRHLPPFNAETAGAMVPNIVAGRIANRLDLMGPSYTVDAACASSLVAADIAVRDLRNREYDLALVGGVQVTTPIPILTLFCQLKALSFGEQIRPFDKDADGTILSEGLGMAVLKRRKDADRDGDRIYAVIKGMGVASDGRAMSVLAPRVYGEELALRRAYEQTGISPRTIGLIEAHGTATIVGDAAEVEALTRVFGGRDGNMPWCALGTVKSMIGHTMPAAGIAGLIKAALALHHKVLPPTLNVDQPNPRLQLEKSPFYINTEPRPWIHGSTETPRRAGVNTFGFGGINAHVILEEYPLPDETSVQSHQLHWDTEVCILQGESRADLIRQGERLQCFLQATPNIPLKDLAYTLNIQFPIPNLQSPTRLAIVASSPKDLQQKLDRALERLDDPACRKIKMRDGVYFFEEPLGRGGKLAFLFPGEGSQYVNMLADLCFHFPEVRACFDEMDRVFVHHARDYVPSDFVFPRPAFSEDEQRAAEDQLWQMDVAIEALLTANHALYTLLARLGIQPDAMLGHSTGEYSAMRAAGMLDEESYDQLLLELNRLYEGVVAEGGIPEATLLAVGAGRDQVAAIVEEVGGDLYLGMDNCPHQVVLVGSKEAADQAIERIRRQGFIYEILPFDRAYHTPLFAPYAEALRESLAGWIVAPPQTPLYSCTIVAPYPSDTSTGLSTSLAETRRIAHEHWAQPVEFRQTIEAMYADGVRLFVEVGPRGNLTAFVDDILRGRPYLAVPANVVHRSGITQLNHLVGLLAAHGVPMQLEHLYDRRAPRKLNLDRPSDPTGEREQLAGRMKLATGWPPMDISEDTAARLRERIYGVGEQTEKPGDGETSRVAAAMRPADQPEVERPGDQAASNQIMSAYLQTMEHFLEMQQEVMQAYLASADHRPPTTDHRQPAPLAASSAESEVLPSAEAKSLISNIQYLPPAEITQILLQLVSEKTGYPTEMLDLNLDLEADLGIDSIKRVEILGVFQQQTGVHLGEQMEQLAACRTLQAMIEFLTTDDHRPPTANSEQESARAKEPRSPISNTSTVSEAALSTSLQSIISRLPFVQEVVALTPGEALEARCEISLDTCPFLRDHTLGRQVSLTDDELMGLPVMPLTMSMEMLAEAAQLLIPDKVLVGMRDVRAYRWIALEDDRLTLKITATRKPSPSSHEIHVQVSDAGAQTVHGTPVIEGTMIFDETYPDPPAVSAFELREERPSHWMPEKLYEEGMFHGPAFRGVVSMDRWGEDGAEATLEVLPLEGLFASGAGQTLLTDPVLLDQPGQVVAFWMAEHLERGYVIFPFRLEALHLYGPPLSAHACTEPGRSEHVKCQARIALVGDWQVRSDLDVVQRDGRVWARFVGWEDKRFDLPRALFRFLLSPQNVVLSESQAISVASLPEGEEFQAYRLGLDAFPEDFFTAHGGIWQRVLVHLVLSRRERELWRSLRMPELRRLEWLLGRVVAKDAVRQHLKQRYGLSLCPADIEILPDDNGRPVCQGVWTDQLPGVPILSLSHTSGVAMAVAGDCSAGVGVGVDIEHVGRMNEDVEGLAFTPEEQELLSSVRHASDDGWPLRFWCAKEAVAKALGQGMIGGPQALVVKALDAVTGTVKMSLDGEMARRCPGSNNMLTVYTAREGDLIIATALCERTRV